jgi:hypothetical protein
LYSDILIEFRKVPAHNQVPADALLRHLKSVLVDKPVVPTFTTIVPMATTTTTTTVALKVTDKLWQRPADQASPTCVPLTQEELGTFLSKFPALMQVDVAQGSMKAGASILAIHDQGIPQKIGDKQDNEKLRDQMRFIMRYIHNAQPTCQESLLDDLVKRLLQCVPVTQGYIDLLYQKLTGGGDFPKWFDSFIAQQKDWAIDRVLNEMFPEFTNDLYADQHHSQPWMQQPHVKNGFIKVCGEQIGFMPAGAQSDPNANRDFPVQRGQEFVQRVKEQLVLNLRENFIRYVNASTDHEFHGIFLNWCAQQRLETSCFLYIEDKAYPKNYPKPRPEQEDMTEAYIDEKAAIMVLEKLGFVPAAV